MKYVTEISAEGYEKLPHFRYSVWFAQETFSKFKVCVVVHDSAFSADHYIRNPDLLVDGIVGFGLDSDGIQGHLVCHTSKSALLHRYISDVQSGTSDDIKAGYTDENKVVIHGHQCKFKDLISDSREIIVNTTSESICFFGAGGSVAASDIGPGHDPITMTLYDMLSRLCRESGVNLMQYDTIKFRSSLYNTWTNLSLKHNAESDRYFTKMWMDINQRG